MPTVFDVARYIKHKLGPQCDLKMQKLCYYSQAWGTVWTGEALISDRLEAWRDGPVFPILWRTQRHYPDRFDGDFTLSDVEKLVVDQVLAAYGHRTPDELSELTHRETPWLEARGEAPSDAHTDTLISPDVLRGYFASITKSAREWSDSETVEESVVAVIGDNDDALRLLA